MAMLLLDGYFMAIGRCKFGHNTPAAPTDLDAPRPHNHSSPPLPLVAAAAASHAARTLSAGAAATPPCILRPTPPPVLAPAASALNPAAPLLAPPRRAPLAAPVPFPLPLPVTAPAATITSPVALLPVFNHNRGPQGPAPGARLVGLCEALVCPAAGFGSIVIPATRKVMSHLVSRHQRTRGAKGERQKERHPEA